MVLKRFLILNQKEALKIKFEAFEDAQKLPRKFPELTAHRAITRGRAHGPNAFQRAGRARPSARIVRAGARPSADSPRVGILRARAAGGPSFQDLILNGPEGFRNPRNACRRTRKSFRPQER
ncbi:hypothetical protein L484_002834 [Morus notabilis]|uniref:Uncharacterized protein n=1 Tax=Morus notabilis TaxID=981085 RepID=W9QBB2_9ROSA|nr:hypothetical protein L484_002834 [Morus notabilis]